MATYERVWERTEAPRPKRAPPKVTYILLGIMAAFLLIQVLVRSVDPVLEVWAFMVYTDWYFARPWSPITSTFAHANFFHLFINGIGLYFFGPMIESIIGRKRFVWLFLVTGALSGILQVHLEAYVNPPGGPALGASGAIMAVLGTAVALLPKARVIMFFPIPLPMPLWLMGALYAFQDVIGAFNPNDGIGNFAHLSGLAIGLGYGVYVKADLKRRGLRLAYN